MSTLNVHASSSTTTSNTSSSIRPRGSRLVSYLSGTDAAEAAPPASHHGTPPLDSRSASPIPPAHPQRSSSKQPASASASSTSAPKFAGSSWGRRAQMAAQKYVPAESPTFAGMWGQSWSTIQGLASDILGNEEEPVKEGQKKKKKQQQQQQQQQRQSFGSWNLVRTLSPNLGGGGGPGEWGPPRASSPATTSVGTGTREEREAALRAQKRKDMLLRQDSSYADALGKFKRRLSDDYESTSVPPKMGNAEDESAPALVYVHHVQKDDTMAGISIKYSCTANIVRKANRMWPNDTPQSRQTLVIPIDACGVKGRLVPDPSTPAVDLLTSEEADTPNTNQTEHLSTPKIPLPNGDNPRTRTSSLSTDNHNHDDNNNPPWHHDSWVQLPNFPQPTEIARLSRRTLGYFPPARRKSASFDADRDRNTPSTSLDLARNSTANGSIRPEESSTSSPQRPRRGNQQKRRLSNSANGYFPSYLNGPGGVGTMNKNVRCPGPAQDGLNKMFAKHLPDVAPPKNQIDLYHPDLPLTTFSDDYTPSGSGVNTPSGSSKPNINLENVGGAIESWVRRMASKATTPSEQAAKSRAARASVGTPGKGGGGIGDLIEMTDEFEIGGGSDDDEDDYSHHRHLQQQPPPHEERGRQKSGTGRAFTAAKSGSANAVGAAGWSGEGGDYFGTTTTTTTTTAAPPATVAGAKGGSVNGNVARSSSGLGLNIVRDGGWKGSKGD